MLKRFFAFLVSVALIASPLAAEGLNSSDLNFAFGKSDTQAPQLSSDLSIMTNQQMSETEGEVVPVVAAGVIGVRASVSAYKAYKVVKAAGRNGGSIKPHTTTKNGKKNKDKHTKLRSGRTDTKQRTKKGWFQR